MRLLMTAVLLIAATGIAQTSDEQAVLATVQKVFQGMAAHDAAMIRSTMLPDARLLFVRDSGVPGSISAEDFISRITTAQGTLLERFKGQPNVLVHGRIAQVWGDYEFLRDGKFNHCGVDTVTLFKTADGWKIATLAYTTETTGCV